MKILKIGEDTVWIELTKEDIIDLSTLDNDNCLESELRKKCESRKEQLKYLYRKFVMGERELKSQEHLEGIELVKRIEFLELENEKIKSDLDIQITNFSSANRFLNLENERLKEENNNLKCDFGTYRYTKKKRVQES